MSGGLFIGLGALGILGGITAAQAGDYVGKAQDKLLEGNGKNGKGKERHFLGIKVPNFASLDNSFFRILSKVAGYTTAAVGALFVAEGIGQFFQER